MLDVDRSLTALAQSWLRGSLDLGSRLLAPLAILSQSPMWHKSRQHAQQSDQSLYLRPLATQRPCYRCKTAHTNTETAHTTIHAPSPDARRASLLPHVHDGRRTRPTRPPSRPLCAKRDSQCPSRPGVDRPAMSDRRKEKMPLAQPPPGSAPNPHGAHAPSR